jgi:hypothetical protein
MSVTSGATNTANSINSHSLTALRGRADCILLSAGQSFLAHRGMISSRCAVLREYLIEESPLDDNVPGSQFTPTQVLLPEFLSETTKVIIYFLYTDCLPSKCVRTVSLLQNVERAARKLRLPRLQVACNRLIQIHNAASSAQSNRPVYAKTDDDDNNDTAASFEKIFNVFSQSSLTLDLPPSTLARDLGSLVGDSLYADVRFIAEGRSISAHRFILESRCEYFRILFRSGMQESLMASTRDYSTDDDSPPVVDIVVPDTFVGLLRFLIYLYTDILPDGSDGALLEDLMSADRYQMDGMKVLCENMLVPSHNNWLDLLRAARLFNCSRLETEVIGFLRDNISDLSIGNTSQILTEEFPDLITNIMTMRQRSFPMPPSQALLTRAADNSKDVSTFQGDSMSWWSIALTLIGVIVYQYVLRVVALGPLVPVINLVGLAGVGYYFYTMLMS